jgi:hypothetical protein
MIAYLLVFACGAISGVIVAVGVLYVRDQQPDDLDDTERLVGEITAMRDAADCIDVGATRLVDTVRNRSEVRYEY